MSVTVIPLNRATVALEVAGELVDISAGVRGAKLALAGQPAAYYTLESAWARQADGGTRGAALLTVAVDSATGSACRHLLDWLLARDARQMVFTQGEGDSALVYSGQFRLVGQSPLAEARAGDGKPATLRARLALDGPLALA